MLLLLGLFASFFIILTEDQRQQRRVAAHIESLKGGTSHERHHAAMQLSLMPKQAGEAVPALRKTLSDPEASVRGAAVLALGHIENAGSGADSAVPDLMAALNDADRRVRELAARALRMLAPASPNTVQALLAALKAESAPEVQTQILYYLRERLPSPAAAVAALIGVLESSDEEVAELIIDVLERYGAQSRSALPALEQMAARPNPRLREAAVRAIKSIQSSVKTSP